MTDEPQTENRGAGGRDGDLETLRKQAFNQAARHGTCTAANDLARLAKEARDERDEWEHLEGVEPTALRIRAEAAEADLAALRAERDQARDDALRWMANVEAAIYKGMDAEAEAAALRARVEALEGALGRVLELEAQKGFDNCKPEKDAGHSCGSGWNLVVCKNRCVARVVHATLAGGTAEKESAGVLE